MVQVYNSKKSFVSACINEVTQDNENWTREKLEAIDLRKLISMAIEVGNDRVDSEDGWGWYNVVVADNVELFDD
jgi:hypothetical protein